MNSNPCLIRFSSNSKLLYYHITEKLRFFDLSKENEVVDFDCFFNNDTVYVHEMSVMLPSALMKCFRVNMIIEWKQLFRSLSVSQTHL